MVIFPKISLKSFIHDLTQTLYFLNNRTKEIFDKYIVDRIFPYQVLTDTDSMLLFIIFIWKPESSVFQTVILEICSLKPTSTMK